MDERPVESSVEWVFREERGRLLATLVRRFGDLDLAEDVTSEAIEAALEHWPVEGVPDRPGAWLLTTATMAQRIVRAKKKIRQARIPFRVPGADELPERLPGVLQVIYSIFTEGHAASSGARLQRLDRAEEAIRLARILRRLLASEREVAGLLALMLLVHARREARTGPGGEIVLLDEQDRDHWDQSMIEEGGDLVLVALTGGPPGPYGVQAAIAALHDEAADVASTD
ncbi:RNA polymerase sigma factor [Nonomuraea dietziae]|uniref:RNA polymerase sigma factor n=1 Tax=Nonomuraea dietziae TaxID=65515 RepID=UPI0034128D14